MINNVNFLSDNWERFLQDFEKTNHDHNQNSVNDASLSQNDNLQGIDDVSSLSLDNKADKADKQNDVANSVPASIAQKDKDMGVDISIESGRKKYTTEYDEKKKEYKTVGYTSDGAEVTSYYDENGNFLRNRVSKSSSTQAYGKKWNVETTSDSTDQYISANGKTTTVKNKTKSGSKKDYNKFDITSPSGKVTHIDGITPKINENHEIKIGNLVIPEGSTVTAKYKEDKYGRVTESKLTVKDENGKTHTYKKCIWGLKVMWREV